MPFVIKMWSRTSDTPSKSQVYCWLAGSVVIRSVNVGLPLPAAALAGWRRGGDPRRGRDPRRLRLRVAALGHADDKAAETSRRQVDPDRRPVAVQDAEVVAITVPAGAQHGEPRKADPRHPPPPQAEPRLGIGRHGDDGREAHPDVTVETPDLLAQGETDYQVPVVHDQLGHQVENKVERTREASLFGRDLRGGPCR